MNEMKRFRIGLMMTIALLVQLSLVAQKKETRDVGNFDEIQTRVSGTVYVTIGNKNEVVLEGNENDLEEVETRVERGRLVIKHRRDNRWKFWGHGNLRITAYVTVKALNGAYVSGSGDIIGKNQIKADDFTASISGSGDIELDLDANYVSSRISGSGNIELEGKSERSKLSISGSGKYFAEKLISGDYEISMSGSGRGSVNCEGDLDVRISGSGKIYYMGKPTSVNSSVSGSGSVRRIN